MNQYTDGSPENTDAVDVRYYNFDNETEEAYQPWLDVCYKEVPIKKCIERDGYVEVNNLDLGLEG